jgi:hypothetical protein
MVRMMEPEILVYSLEKDKEMVNSILRTCEKKFNEIIEDQLGTSNLLIKRNGLQVDIIQ